MAKPNGSGWRWVRGTGEKRVYPASGPGDIDYVSIRAVIVYCVDGHIVAAIDERLKDHPTWEAMADWGGGLMVPVCSNWRSANFGIGMQPLADYPRVLPTV